MDTPNENIKHLEECPGCHECDYLLEFYMSCDKCGSWGHTDSDGFEMVENEIGTIQFLCHNCSSQEGEKA